MKEEIRYLENILEIKIYDMGCIDRKYDEKCQQAYGTHARGYMTFQDWFEQFKKI